MKKEVKFILLALIASVLSFFVGQYVAAETLDTVEQATIQEITAAAQVVEAPVVSDPVVETTDVVTVTLPAKDTTESDCHVTVAGDTTVTMLGKIGVLLDEAGCNVSSWWSSFVKEEPAS